MQNSFMESFNGRMRDELLDETLFRNFAHARDLITAYRSPDPDLVSRGDRSAHADHLPTWILEMNLLRRFVQQSLNAYVRMNPIPARGWSSLPAQAFIFRARNPRPHLIMEMVPCAVGRIDTAQHGQQIRAPC